MAVEVSYSLAREDYWQFVRYLSLHTPKLRFTFILNIVLPLAIAVVGALVMGVIAPLRWALPFACFFLVVGASCSYWAYGSMKRRVKGLVTDKPGMLGDHTLAISSEGLRDRTPVSEGTWSWVGVTGIIDAEDYIFAMVDIASGFIIPKRAFSSVEEMGKFLRMTTELWTRSGPAGEATSPVPPAR